MEYYSDNKNSKYYYSNETPVIEEEESNFNILEWVFKFLPISHSIKTAI